MNKISWKPRNKTQIKSNLKVTKEILAPKTDPPLKEWPDFRLRNHNREKIMYNMNAPNEGRLFFSPNELAYAPKVRIDQQQLPAYFLETDLAAKVLDYDAVLYSG